ncbi:MAG: L,D-transpeptidase [Solirubrobacterales bacterium]
MSRRIAIVTGLLALLCVAPATARADLALRPPGAKLPLGNERLSDERTVTRSAHTNLRSKIYADPALDGRVVGRLRFQTEDGPPEVYLALQSHVDAAGQIWIRIRIPARPNGQKGWVRREALGSFSISRVHLIVNRRTLRAKLLKAGKLVFSTRVGVGKASTPTPAGRFYAREKLESLEGGTIYGPWAIGTSAYSSISDWPGGGVVGIHGTNQPQLIPGRPSHGCIRMPNRKIRRLVKLMPVGTPIRIK